MNQSTTGVIIGSAGEHHEGAVVTVFLQHARPCDRAKKSGTGLRPAARITDDEHRSGNQGRGAKHLDTMTQTQGDGTVGAQRRARILESKIADCLTNLLGGGPHVEGL